jgi:hypothetical protein
MTATVRRATLADAPAMGRVVVRAWQAAYRGHMPDDYLDGLRAEDRAAYWEGVLGREDLRGTILVVERDGEVIGFAAVGPSPDPEGPGSCTRSTSTRTIGGPGPGGRCSARRRRSLPGWGSARRCCGC